MIQKSVFVVCSLLACCASIPDRAEAGIFDWFNTLTPKAQRAKDTLQDFDELVEKALKEYEVPGIAIGIVVDGQVILAKGYGFRDLEKKKAVTADTIFPIGSLTKAMTCFVAGTLVDEGAMKWDELVLDLLPDFRLYDTYAYQHMTMRDLLTHRSGMPRHDFMWYNSDLTRSELFRRLRYLEPASEFRERYHYNNLMYFTAGYAMEEITGKSWETLVSERIFKPLGMKNSYFTLADMQKSSDYSFPYLQKDDQLVRMGFRDFTLVGPAVSINSSVNDLNRWVEMLLNHGVYKETSLINGSTLQEMFSPQVVVSGTPEHKEAFLSTYGLGWGVLSYRGHYSVSHDGGPDGFTTVISLLPNEGIGVVVLGNKNLSTLPRFISLEAIDRILELAPLNWYAEGLDTYLKAKESLKALKSKEDLSRKKNTVPSHALEDYAGEYEHPGYGTIAIEFEDGQLKSTYNKIRSTLDHWHYDVFTVSKESEDLIFSRVGTKLTFRTNYNGDIDELIVPFEAGVDDIVFKKKASGQFAAASYLKKFAGLYEIYGITVEIALRDQGLIAIIPGQPIFELIPNVENEFNVKSKTGYTVRFVMSEGAVQEVLLVQPYGAFTAKPKR
ncbi:MAG: serine hydrolase [Verrucomicrobia bacterium]|nr:serine hydrolase [Verrucomicrobiota bacterium]